MGTSWQLEMAETPREPSELNLTEVKIDPSVVDYFPPELIRLHSFLPLRMEGDKIWIAVSNPDDHAAIEKIQKACKKELQIFYVSESAIMRKLREVMPLFFERLKINENRPGIETQFQAEFQKLLDTKDSVSELINKILYLAVQSKVSDIHLEPQESGLFVRYRVDGILRTVKRVDKSQEPATLSCLKVMAKMDISEKRLPQDGQFNAVILGRRIDFRVSSLPSKFGEKIVLRVLDKGRQTLDLDKIQMDPRILAPFKEIIQKPQGLLLVTGPTGSGKTTTLYSVLNFLVSSEKNIITLEDPAEYDLLAGRPEATGITQVAIHSKIGMTFATGLRAALRQDPDIIMVGEIRDKETAEIAMKSSLTGHFVLSTLHTNDAFSTIIRLKDMGVEPYLVTSTILGIMAQRLVRVLCEDCKQPIELPEAMLLALYHDPAKLKERSFFKPVGCRKCHMSGYMGRRGIYELLIMNESLRDLVQTQARPDATNPIVQESLLSTLRQSGLDMASRGVTTLEEVYRTTV